MLDFIQLNHLTDAVDLVSWGHNDLFLTKKEKSDGERALKHAHDAQVDVNCVSKLSAEEMDKVGVFTLAFHGYWLIKSYHRATE